MADRLTGKTVAQLVRSKSPVRSPLRGAPVTLVKAGIPLGEESRLAPCRCRSACVNGAERPQRPSCRRRPGSSNCLGGGDWWPEGPIRERALGKADERGCVRSGATSPHSSNKGEHSWNTASVQRDLLGLYSQGGRCAPDSTSPQTTIHAVPGSGHSSQRKTGPVPSSPDLQTASE